MRPQTPPTSGKCIFETSGVQGCRAVRGDSKVPDVLGSQAFCGNYSTIHGGTLFPFVGAVACADGQAQFQKHWRSNSSPKIERVAGPVSRLRQLVCTRRPSIPHRNAQFNSHHCVADTVHSALHAHGVSALMVCKRAGSISRKLHPNFLKIGPAHQHTPAYHLALLCTLQFTPLCG